MTSASQPGVVDLDRHLDVSGVEVEGATGRQGEVQPEHRVFGGAVGHQPDGDDAAQLDGQRFVGCVPEQPLQPGEQRLGVEQVEREGGVDGRTAREEDAVEDALHLGGEDARAQGIDDDPADEAQAERRAATAVRRAR